MLYSAEKAKGQITFQSWNIVTGNTLYFDLRSDYESKFARSQQVFIAHQLSCFSSETVKFEITFKMIAG